MASVLLLLAAVVVMRRKVTRPLSRQLQVHAPRADPSSGFRVP